MSVPHLALRNHFACVLLLAFLLAACATGESLTSQLNANADEIGKLPLDDHCASEIKALPDFDVIRNKIELTRRLSDGPPPSSITSDTSIPSEQEAKAISGWNFRRHNCYVNLLRFLNLPTPPISGALTTLQQDSYFGVRAHLAIIGLAGDLGFRLITYGDYARRSYNIASEALAAERLYRRSVIAKDVSGQRQALDQLARETKSWDQDLYRDSHGQGTVP